ncbi:post-GPI attachment to proteins factor 3 [Dermacentor albipictus]|uniref:post-GPI attachment to proteins factor 3 n=1 Tax=Dermacentor albipictus TaxID=60249 RepID=UPI0038FC8152
MLIRWAGLRRPIGFLFCKVMIGPSQASGITRTAAAVSLAALLLCLFDVVSASPGDQSAEYKSCLRRCRSINCTQEKQTTFRSGQAWYLALLLWDCADECRHECMWHAVDVLQAKDKPVPQFHGKWPFWRFYGIQEPASVIFSILNGICHLWMWRKFRRLVPSSAPFYVIWKGQAVLSINAWFWSAVFHARDTPLTEKLDYYCAFSVVLYSLYSLCMRVLGTKNTGLSISVTVPFAAFFVYHIQYLNFVHFDYGYNMKANVITGLLNSIGWLGWCWHHRKRGYVWRGTIVVFMLDALLLLELGDFPPWCFLVDAHALWHLGTAPLPLLWYRFLIDDSLYELHKMQNAGKAANGQRRWFFLGNESMKKTPNDVKVCSEKFAAGHCTSCQSHEEFLIKAKVTQNGNSIGEDCQKCV